jgi:hypothetical protein
LLRKGRKSPAQPDEWSEASNDDAIRWVIPQTTQALRELLKQATAQ